MAGTLGIRDSTTAILCFCRCDKPIWTFILSLILNHCMMGSVTSSIMWQSIGESENIHGRLWKIGMRALRSMECGLFKARNLLLSKNLLGKIETVA